MIQVAYDAIAHYLATGETKDVATALVAVFYAESKLATGPQNNAATDKGGALTDAGAVGIMSLNGPRQKLLQDYAIEKGVPWDNLTTQLNFARTEIANNFHDVWTAMKTPGTSYSDLIKLLVDVYENPKDHAAEIARAMNYAQEFYAYNVTPAFPLDNAQLGAAALGSIHWAPPPPISPPPIAVAIKTPAGNSPIVFNVSFSATLPQIIQALSDIAAQN